MYYERDLGINIKVFIICEDSNILGDYSEGMIYKSMRNRNIQLIYR